MIKQPWALILGASSGFGEATALELARAGMNIFGVHLDRRDKLFRIVELQQKIHEFGRESEFFNINAALDDKRREVMEKITKRLADAPGGTLRVPTCSVWPAKCTRSAIPNRTTRARTSGCSGPSPTSERLHGRCCTLPSASTSVA